jgi:2-polyprenyl-6-methoxyphenol hydroxylase-like FAD-dependent oxidoreductase
VSSTETTGADYDVVVVGGGIAGAALAAQLAGAGRRVLVLEAQESYRDKVRGETIQPWGVREVAALGLEETLLGAGGEYTDALVPYDENNEPSEAEAQALPYSLVAPDVKGTLNVGHPEACEALAAHAAQAGADVRRGIADSKVRAGAHPSVTWADAAGSHEVSCRMVVGADGRTSGVRRQLRIELEERPAVTFGSGLLVKGHTGFRGHNTMGTDGEELFLAFPRTDGYTRLYLLVDIARQRQFTGPGRLETFLSHFAKPSFPASTALAAAEVVGPCGGSPMTDSWTVTAPVVEGAVLIGDAAGWNDPIIGQGLCIALRDARSVAEVLLQSEDWSPSAFSAHVEERAERMRRLAVCARVHTAMRCHFDQEWKQRRRRWSEAIRTDPVAMAQAACCLAGPEAFEADAFSDTAVEATLAM